MIKYKYNPLKRTFNLLAAVFGIFAAVGILFLAGGGLGLTIDGFSRESNSILFLCVLIVIATAGIVLDIIFLVITSKLCKKAKKLEDGEFKSRRKINVYYIVFLILGTMVSNASMFLSTLLDGNGMEELTKRLVIIIAVVGVAFLIVLQAVYMSLKTKVIDKSLYLKVGDDAERFSCIAKDLKTLFYEDTLTKKQFIYAFNALTEGFLESHIETYAAQKEAEKLKAAASEVKPTATESDMPKKTVKKATPVKKTQVKTDDKPKNPAVKKSVSSKSAKPSPAKKALLSKTGSIKPAVKKTVEKKK